MKAKSFTQAGCSFLALSLILTLSGWRGSTLLQPVAPVQETILPQQAQATISATIGADQGAYHAIANDGGYFINNPAQELGAQFSSGGVRFSTRTHSWELSLSGYGYGDAVQPVQVAIPAARGNRIDYSRGVLTEWYINGPFGVEQGFTLSAPPAVKSGGPLTLSLRQGGDLQAAVEANGRELCLHGSDPSGLMRYSGLTAYDAGGQALTTWLESRNGKLLIRVNDMGARYPLTIDPFLQKAKLTASDQAADDKLGASIAISGDVVVIGATTVNYDPTGTNINDVGAAYIFVKPGGGWADMTQVAKLSASDKQAYDYLGYSVAIDGDVIAVGAINGGSSDKGSVYVYIKPVDGWADKTQDAILTASDGASSDSLGRSVAIDGDVIVTGAIAASSGGVSHGGAAYLFVKPGGGWANMTQTAKLTASNAVAWDWYGISVAVSGDVVVVGADSSAPGGLADAGSAYVYVKPGGGWADNTEDAILTASDATSSASLGSSVAIEGDVTVAGASDASSGAVSYAGAVYVFVKPGGGWDDMTQTAKLTASDIAGFDSLGVSASINNDIVVAGAQNHDPESIASAGAVYVFAKPAGGWVNATQTSKLTASDKTAGDQLGISVGVSGNTVAAGARNADVGGKADAGAGYVFIPGSVTSITSDAPDPSLTGQSLPVQVTVSVDLTAPTGTVNISGADTNCSITLSSGGGSCNVKFKTPGAKTLTATYTGNSTYSGSSDTESHQVNPRTIIYRSVGANDGWVLESTETSSVGGSINSTATTFFLGDNRADKQYKAILSFNTGSLPDSAVITSVVLKIKKQGLVGVNPFTTHKPLYVDIRKPYFGTAITLAANDFEAAASKGTVGTFGNVPISNWYSVTLNNTAYPYINLTGTTQFRLRFKLGDDNDDFADYMKFFSGNSGVSADKPLLIIQYYAP